MDSILPSIYLGCCFIAIILLLNMISQAFNRSFLWGFICLLFPAGTYVYCKKHWGITRHLAIPMTLLLVVGIIFKIIMYLSS
jgi:predicted membrane protein